MKNITITQNHRTSLKNIIAMVAVLTLALLTPTINYSDQAQASNKQDSNFGVGTGVIWPDQVAAPYVDFSRWASGDGGINGVLNLETVAKDTGMRFFNLGFIQTVNVEKNRINWGWGGFETLNEAKNNSQHEGMKQNINNLRSLGGDVAISFGGLHEGAFWDRTNDVSVLVNTYKEIITGYGLTRIDLDIEGSSMNIEHNKTNAAAIKQVQDKTGVELTLTLPVMNFGLTGDGLNVLKTYLEAGVDIKVINLMTMCYGTSVPDYVQGSIDAVDTTKNQIQQMYKSVLGVSLSEEEAYRKLGSTPSIGFESDAHPYFGPEMTKKLVEHAQEKALGMFSFWSMNRDSKTDGGAGKINEKYEHSKYVAAFGDSNPKTDANNKGNLDTSENNTSSNDDQSTSDTEEKKSTIKNSNRTSTDALKPETNQENQLADKESTDALKPETNQENQLADKESTDALKPETNQENQLAATGAKSLTITPILLLLGTGGMLITYMLNRKKQLKPRRQALS